MQQSTLNSWLNISVKKKHPVFYLNWLTSTPQTRWLDTVPKDTNFNETIKWQFDTITICGDLPSVSKPIPNKTKYNSSHIPFLKSQLQKTIRRQMTKNATRTACEFLQVNASEFLRRLSIIMIEDVYLHQSLPVIVWLMCAVAKGYELNYTIYTWLVNVVGTLCQIDKYDVYEGMGIDIKNVADYHDIEDNEQLNMLYCLQLRKAYGGMRCDQEMLNKATRQWYQRFQDGKTFDKTLVNDGVCHVEKSMTKSSTISFLNLKTTDWLLEAIDFHCSPYIIKWIRKKHTDLTDGSIKAAIWNNSSKINTRYVKNDTCGTQYIWKRIQYDVINAQKYIIDKYISTPHNQ